jgi:hypothetical protein
MRYEEFRDGIEQALSRRRAGLTWQQLRTRLNLPYKQPCPSWVRRLEQDIGLRRSGGSGRALVWKVSSRPQTE